MPFKFIVVLWRKMPLFIDQETWFQVQQYVFVNKVVFFFLKSVAKLDTEQIWLARTSIRAILNNIKTRILFTHWNQQYYKANEMFYAEIIIRCITQFPLQINNAMFLYKDIRLENNVPYFRFIKHYITNWWWLCSYGSLLLNETNSKMSDKICIPPQLILIPLKTSILRVLHNQTCPLQLPFDWFGKKFY